MCPTADGGVDDEPTTVGDLDDQPGASVLTKMHMLLAAFSPGTTALGLTELSRRSGVPKATAHRLCMELVQLGYLSRTTKAYELGWRIFELGQLVSGPASLRGVARPALVDLRTATRAVINLAVPHGRDCLYLERLAGRREANAVAAVGTRVPNCRTACGRVFLAYSPDQDAALEALDEADLDWLAARGLNDPARLRSELADIRTHRWAGDRQLCVAGIKSLAVPVFLGGSDRVIAAIAATLPVERRDDQQVLHALWAAAADISRGLGGRQLPQASGPSASTVLAG